MPHEQPGSLLTRTIELVRQAQEAGVTTLDIYKATGLKPFWIQSVVSGRTTNPSVNRIQLLYEYLRRQPLVSGTRH